METTVFIIVVDIAVGAFMYQQLEIASLFLRLLVYVPCCNSLL